MLSASHYLLYPSVGDTHVSFIDLLMSVSSLGALSCVGLSPPGVPEALVVAWGGWRGRGAREGQDAASQVFPRQSALEYGSALLVPPFR